MHRRYQIDLPIAPYTGTPLLVPVSVDSSRKLRVHVERFARYFLNEMQTGGIQFEAAESTHSLGFVEYKAFLFSFQDRFVGAACFRYRDDQDNEHEGQVSHFPQMPNQIATNSIASHALRH